MLALNSSIEFSFKLIVKTYFSSQRKEILVKKSFGLRAFQKLELDEFFKIFSSLRISLKLFEAFS